MYAICQTIGKDPICYKVNALTPYDTSKEVKKITNSPILAIYWDNEKIAYISNFLSAEKEDFEEMNAIFNQYKNTAIEI